MYDQVTVERIHYIQLLKSQHLSLEEISGRLELFDQHSKEVDPAVLFRTIKRVSERLAEVEKEIQGLKPSLAKLKSSESKRITRDLAAQALSISQAILLILP